MGKFFRLGFVLVAALVVGLTLLWAQTGESQADDPPPLDITADGKLMLTFSSGANVKLVFVEAGYNNDFGIASPVDQHIFYCKDVPPGYTVDLGTFSPGELMFKLTSPEAYTYYTGPADRNPDNVVHALIDRLSPSAAQIQWEDIHGGGDLDYNDCVVDIVVEPVEADLKIVSQQILAANCVDPPPAEIDISSGVQICLKKVLHNNGPRAPVDVDITKTATAPPGCTILPTSPSDQVTLDVSANVEHTELFTIHCSEPSTHGPFVIENTIAPKNPDIIDPVPTNNSTESMLTVDAIAYADAKITAQWVVGCDDLNANTICDLGEPTHPAPLEIPVSQDIPIMVKKTIHNNGPYGPVDLQTVKTAVASPDCEVTPGVHVEQILNVPANQTVTHNEPFTVHCHKPSEHTFTFDNVISVKDPHVTDLEDDNDRAHTEWTVKAIATADLEIVDQRYVVWPTNVKVSENVLVTLETDVKNNGSYGPVEAEFEGWLVTPTPCTVSDLVSEQVTLAASETQTIQQQFTIHCSQKCLQTFTFHSRITAKDPHVREPDPDLHPNYMSETLPSVHSWAQADVMIVSHDFVSPPTEMQISVDTPVTLRKVLRNDGPYTGNVTVTITKTAAAPADCTISPLNHSEDVLLLDNLNVTVDEVFTIHCSKDGAYNFSVDNLVSGPKDLHVEDPNLPNTAHTGLMVQAIGEADVKIIDQYFVDPPSEIDVSDHVDVTLRKVLRNDGPYTGDVTVDITKTATAPDDCSIIPLSVTEEDVLLPDNMNVTVDEPFTIHCSKPSSHTFTVHNDVSGPKEPGIVDPNLPNEATTDLTVDALAEVDVAVSQQILDWPTDINVSENRVVTLKKTIIATVLNSQPYDIPEVEVTVTKSASAPAGCTAVPVGDAIEQKVVSTTAPLVFEETFTIHCTPSNHGPFTFQNVVDEPKDPHISDPIPDNNTAETTGLYVNAWAEVDVAVSQEVLDWPTDIDVSDDVEITLEKTITATVQPPATTTDIPEVEVEVTKTASAPAGCTVTPTEVVEQKTVSTTAPLVFEETFTIHCAEPSTHGPFTFNNVVGDPKDPHISDPESGNNTTQTTGLMVNAHAYADMKVVAQYVEDPPTEIAPSENVSVVLDKVIHNNGPWGPVEVSTETTVTAPTGCTVYPEVHTQQFHFVPVSVDILHHEPFTIHCSGLGEFTFTFDDTVELKEAHVHDEVSGNDSQTTELTVAVVSQADVKIVSADIVDRPSKLPLFEDLDITLEKVLHNNGGYGPVDVSISADATAPSGCSATAHPANPTSATLPVSTDVVVDEVWTIRCTEQGYKTFAFDNSIDVATPYVSDPNQGNNSSHKLLSVHDDASCEADYDGDGLCDASDLCPDNPDCDGDGVLDGADNCPTVPNPTQADFDEDGVGDACDGSDADGDGFTAAVELHVGTDPLAACPLVIGSDDAWPLDIDMTRDVSVTGDVFNYVGRIGATPGSPAWWQRLDLDHSGDLSVTGDVFMYAGMIGRSCV